MAQPPPCQTTVHCPAWHTHSVNRFASIFFATTVLLYDPHAKSVIPLCQANPNQSQDHWNSRHRLVQAHCSVEQSNDWGLRRGQWCRRRDDGHLLTHTGHHYNTSLWWYTVRGQFTLHSWPLHCAVYTQVSALHTHSAVVYKPTTNRSWVNYREANSTCSAADIRPLG